MNSRDVQILTEMMISPMGWHTQRIPAPKEADIGCGAPYVSMDDTAKLFKTKGNRTKGTEYKLIFYN